MDDNPWPQQQPNPFTAHTDDDEVQHGHRAVGQHSVKRLEGGVNRPAGHTQAYQADAGESAHHNAGTNDFCAKQQSDDDWRMASKITPGPDSANAASMRILFIGPSGSLLSLHFLLYLALHLLHHLAPQLLDQLTPMLVAYRLELLLLLRIQERGNFGIDFVGDLLQLL